MNIRRQLTGAWLAAAVTALAPGAFAADFQFGTIIRAGVAGNTDHEMAIGTTGNSPSATGQLNPYYTGGSQFFEIGYLKGTNTAYVRVHQGATSASAFNQASFNPVGGAAAAANAIWTLPASSFFVRATDNTGINLVQVSNLTLSGVTGAANILQPLQATTMVAFQLGFAAQPTVTQSQDLVFRGDSNGNWRLQGNIQMVGLTSNGGVASGSEIEFGVAALAGTPEPMSMSLTFLGVAGMVAFARKRSTRK